MSKDQDIQGNEGELDPESTQPADGEQVIHVSGMFRDYFLDYASYVILERAVPAIGDGLKPVQRRILHSMRELEDGRYNKVANVIGNTMKYHPHGDASIGDAMVQLGQKELLIDMQGNWGNILTGDSAAAPRYIEARLSKFALEVAFNPKTTNWQLSYDGRNKEPLSLPMKFPLLLAQGVEGIAVGLACKILPHNFNELIEASVAYLRKRSFTLLPDFPTAGMVDASQYNDGMRGGKIRVRAKISQLDKKTLLISEIPFGTTTGSLIDSILKANDRGKIKVRKVEDNTAREVEIVVHLAPNVSPDKMIDALYAFTDCEVSISPNAAIIIDKKPHFIGVTEILKRNTDQTVALLKKELEIRMSELEEQWHFSSLEKIFIEKKIYVQLHGLGYEEAIEVTHKLLKPYLKKFIRKITDDDIKKLLEIRMRRITKHDAEKADLLLVALEEEMTEVKHHLDNLIDYAVDYFKSLKKKYGEGKDRQTELKSFDTIQAAKVAVANVKLYVDKEEGFVGFNLKRAESEFVCECSDIDDVIVIRQDGVMIVTRISEKNFVGKNLLHAGIWKKGDNRTIYNMIYQDGPKGTAMMKRFAVTAITRDKEYDLTKGSPGSEILYLTANPNGESEVVTAHLKPVPKLKRLKLDIDFAQLAIKGMKATGNQVTKFPVKKIELKEKGLSTLGARKIWFDEAVHRINADERGVLLGEFGADDKILTITQSGHYKLTSFDLSTHFEEDLVIIEKWIPNKPISTVYFDGEKKVFFIKRFLIEKSEKKVCFISESEGSYMEVVSSDRIPVIKLNFVKSKKGIEREPETVNVCDLITIKGLKAQGNRLSQYDVKSVDLLAPIPVDESEFEEFPEDSDEELADGAEDENEDSTDLGEVELPSKSRKSPPIRDDEDDAANQITIEF